LIKNKDFISQCGASLLEVILSIALVLVLVPFMYYQIADMNDSVRDIATARRIVKTQNDAVNFMRVKYVVLDDGVTQLEKTELDEFAPNADYGFIEKTTENDMVSIVIYLGFKPTSLGNVSEYRVANIAKYIGTDAALVHDDNTAYSQFWAVSNSKFKPGNLIYRVTHDFGIGNTSRYLHRSIAGENENGFNIMERDLNMNNKDVRNVNALDANELNFITMTVSGTLNASAVTSDVMRFNRGAAISVPSTTEFNGTLSVNGDLSSSNNLNFDSLQTGTMTVNTDITVSDVFSLTNGKLYLGISATGQVPINNPIQTAEFSSVSTSTLEVMSNITTDILESRESIKLINNSDKIKMGNMLFFARGLVQFNALCIEKEGNTLTPWEYGRCYGGWVEIIDINGNCPGVALPDTEHDWVGAIFH